MKHVTLDAENGCDCGKASFKVNMHLSVTVKKLHHYV
jgi:hypothetical protein